MEAIVVEDAVRFSEDLILAESRLVEGREYDEAQLRDALFRIVRLPLVLDAEFSLRRGTERGRVQLVIRVKEARRWFFGMEGLATIWRRPVTLSGLAEETVVQSPAAIAGRRFSAGRHGVFFAALGGQDGSLNVGYSHNNLFGRRVLLQVNGAYSRCGQAQFSPPLGEGGDEACRTEVFELGLDPTFSAWGRLEEAVRGRFSLGVPLSGNQSFRLAAGLGASDGGVRRQVYDQPRDRIDFYRDRSEWEATASWVLDSRDDPLFASRGQRWEAGLQYRSLSAVVERFTFLEDRGLQRFESDHRARELGVRLTGARYWSVGSRDVLWARLDAFVGRSDLEGVLAEDGTALADEVDTWRGGVAFGYGRFLLRVRTSEKWRELRWDTELEALTSGTSPSFELPQNPLDGYRVSSGLRLRTSWGVFGLQVIYQDLEGR